MPATNTTKPIHSSVVPLKSVTAILLFTMLPSMRLTSRLGLRLVRWNSTAGPTLPPLMTALRTDLKTAMRAKDTPRYF